MSKSADKVIINTGVLYLKMALTVGISLYTTRAILSALGTSDFGVYNLVAGVVALLAFLNAAMSTSTQRYLSVSQGMGNLSHQNSIFNNSLLIHLILGMILVIVFLGVGVFLFDGFLNIDPSRIRAAKGVYYFMILTVFFSVLSVPYVASINAHENLVYIAIVGIIEVLFKLLIAISLPFFEGDRLIYYGGLMAFVSFSSLMLYYVYCRKKYAECKIAIRQNYNKKLLKELSAFAGWNLFGAACGVGRSQGIAVILNLFFGTLINAAYGIANQVASQMNFFSATLLRALNPQIMKSEGANDRNRMISLSMIASKYGFFLLGIFAIPFIFEVDSILDVWLEEIPIYAPVFCQLVLIGILLNQLTIGIQSSLQAVGNIKIYQILVGGLLLANLPIAYLILKLGYPVYTVLVSYIMIEFIACIIRLLLAKRLAKLNITLYLKKVILPIISATIPILIVGFVIVSFFDFYARWVFTCSILMCLYALSIVLIGLNKEEKSYIINIISKLKKKSHIN